MQLSAQAQQELAVYKQTGEIDSTLALYNEVYEHFANAMHPRSRASAALQYDYILRRIKQL